MRIRRVDRASYDPGQAWPTLVHILLEEYDPSGGHNFFPYQFFVAKSNIHS
jgi:hypothetical protein